MCLFSSGWTSGRSNIPAAWSCSARCLTRMCRVSLKHLAGELPPEPVNFQPNDMLPGVFRSVCTSSPLLQHVHPPPLCSAWWTQVNVALTCSDLLGSASTYTFYPVHGDRSLHAGECVAEQSHERGWLQGCSPCGSQCLQPAWIRGQLCVHGSTKGGLYTSGFSQIRRTVQRE